MFLIQQNECEDGLYLSDGAPPVGDRRIWMHPGPWNAFSDAATLDSRNRSWEENKNENKP